MLLDINDFLTWWYHREQQCSVCEDSGLKMAKHNLQFSCHLHHITTRQAFLSCSCLEDTMDIIYFDF